MNSLLEILNSIFQPSVFVTIGSIFVTTLLAITASYFSYNLIFRRTQQYYNSNLLISKALDIICIKIAQETSFKFRANFFMPNKKGKLEIRYSSSSMIGAKDYNITLESGKGATGIAWEQKTSIVAKLEKVEDAVVWGLTKEEAEKTKCLRAILSIPTSHPRFHEKFVGVFSIDSEDDASDYLQNEKVLEMAYTTSAQIAEILMGCGLLK